MDPQFNWIAALEQNKFDVSWATIESNYNEYTLKIKVFKDALKDENGVRHPATAKMMQQIADRTFCTMLTPKLADLIHRQASPQFNAIVNINGKIVADCTVAEVNKEIDKKINECGGLTDKPVSCIGKWWVLVNNLINKPISVCANYGWYSTKAPTDRMSLTKPYLRIWQDLGTQHNVNHYDPSQLVVLAARDAILIKDNNESIVDLLEIAKDPALCNLVNHNGVLQYTRMSCVPETYNNIIVIS